MQKTYREMDDRERAIFISLLVHAINNWHPSFKLCVDAIEEAKKAGKYAKTKFGFEEMELGKH